MRQVVMDRLKSENEAPMRSLRIVERVVPLLVGWRGGAGPKGGLGVNNEKELKDAVKEKEN
jgi:hypothetical protein